MRARKQLKNNKNRPRENPATAAKATDDAVDAFMAGWARERPDLNFRHLATLGRIIRLAAHLHERMDKWLEPYGISWEMFDLLASLRRSGPKAGMRPTDLYQVCILSSGATTNRINRAEKRNYVVRRSDPDDGRAIRIALTGSGRAVSDRALMAHHAHMQQISDVLTPKEQEQLAGLLRKLMVAVEPPRA
ncbi:MAG TPA: MarR family transcriptional regulator [Pseudolabrys sp.]|nr:MarR family transcriptional regulator [Pseudolabrys sp.]